MSTLLTTKDLRGLLRCSVPTVKRLLKRGELAIVRVGRGVLVQKEAVDAWILAHETPATAPPNGQPSDRLARAVQGPPTPEDGRPKNQEG